VSLPHLLAARAAGERERLPRYVLLPSATATPTPGARLFLAFALAFAVFAGNRVVLSALSEESEARTYFYLLRALAFLLIAAAVIDKNMQRRHEALAPAVGTGRRSPPSE
jgi:hypothetical protein